MMDTAAAVKSRLTMRQVAERYGYTVNDAGFIRCPFHGNGNERTASCKLYPEHRGFYCHACGVGGDVTKFVQLLFDIPFLDAAKKLNDDFSLNLPLSHLSESEAARLSKKAIQHERRREQERSMPKEPPDYGAFDREHIYPGGQVKKVFYRRRNGTKYAVWYHMEGGRWTKGRGDIPHILYQRGDPGRRVYIAEGEKDADNLFSLFGGYCASGENGAGKGKWLPEYTKLLRFVGVQCAAVFSDNDTIGRAYAQETAAALSGICCVKLIDLRRIWHDMPEKADVSDYIETHRETVREDIGRLVKMTEIYHVN